MIRRILYALSLISLTIAAGACNASKSSDPLSPSIAGPSPGVNITAPVPIDPTSGAKVAVDQQPVTLMVQNAATNGVRPLTYLVEVATDAGFTNKVFSQDNIAPSNRGKTGVKLPDPLATGRTYYWHSLAKDGANTSAYSAAANFNVFTPTVINAPTPVAPINNVKTADAHPTFQFTNATHTGPVGAITYGMEISDTDTFANKIAIWTVAEQPNQTSLAAPQLLGDSTQYFWHVRAYDPTTTGPWSATQVFQTPMPIVIAPPPPPPPNSGPVASDQMNLSQAVVYNSPQDIASWAVTTTITQVGFQPTGSPTAGVSFAFSPNLPDSWKWLPGFASDSFQYTVWPVVKVNGQWTTSGIVQMWQGRPSTGGPILTDFARSWVYDSRWGTMAGYQPQPGEQMGFFVSAGNARGQSGVTSVRERSNVVLVNVPAGDNGSFSFSVGSMPLMLNLRRR